jgi:hypothetical protein
MSSVTLLHPEETFTIPTFQVMNKCSLFQNNPTLLVSPYRLQSLVSLSVFREFISAIEGNTIKITDTSFTELHRLCEKFDFSELTAKTFRIPSLDGFQRSHSALHRFWASCKRIFSTAICFSRTSTDFSELL